MKRTTLLLLAITTLLPFSLFAGEVVLEVSNFTNQTKQMAELRRNMRGEFWFYNTMGANGASNNAWRTEALFGGHNKVFDCFYRSKIDETHCGPYVWNINNVMFKVEGQCEVKRPSPAQVKLFCRN